MFTSGSKDLDEACHHRLYKSQFMRLEIEDCAKMFVCNANVSSNKFNILCRIDHKQELSVRHN